MGIGIVRQAGDVDPPIAWNDIEALPIYAAVLLGIFILLSGVTEVVPSLKMAALKVVGLTGCLALRQAWIGLDLGLAPPA